ncbi:aldehyde dehydrogenase (NAD+) [Tenacibaculum sp. MAR_2009_124]|uniref:aldehyde dehydrogenase n=1 Tax=Tenacibaculum sp. MAR_2009_124 TaxID=1250059 RepID=UPI000899258C|nr:aldehyde dehydrogenase [Tenacibaculum sp. MAR_2009_124]SEB66165.1 aldehyde dehydrogenase (NAD+) [Tenacibaculum sp. MAR_2009_124]
MSIQHIVQQQKDFFKSQKTKDISFRKKTLKLLLKEIIVREKDIINAIHEDFRKPEYETVMTEISIVVSELKLMIRNINKWSKPKRVFPSILNFPSSAKIYNEPFGNTLIISPWNYPFQLAFAPLIGAIAAGNTVLLKPSELTPQTSNITKKIIEKVFQSSHVSVIEGGVDISQELLQLRWDYIFFTGSVSVGKIIAKAAAEHLTPTTLELGGKSPCIIHKSANLKLAAKRIAWGKFINCGQTCIAPDYVLIHSSIKDKFTTLFKEELQKAYGNNPESSEDFARIINTKNFERLQDMITNETVSIGGKTNKENHYISPTLVDSPSLTSKVMQEEIFGPILPLISYTSEEEIDEIISKYEKPLAFYVFSNKKSFAKKMISKHSFGGGTINDTTVHFANHRLPFGGIGESGVGSYHGKRSFDTFTHQKGVVSRGTWLDIPTRYAPYKGKLKQLKMLLKLGS